MKRGFTLIELMIVVAIVGILAAVAIPAFCRALQHQKCEKAGISREECAQWIKDHENTQESESVE